MNPKVWGPVYWEEFHKATLRPSTFPTFLRHFTRNIPCIYCQRHFQTITSMYPPPETVQGLRIWGVDVHNMVNLKTGKPKFPYQRFNQKYQRFILDVDYNGRFLPREG